MFIVRHQSTVRAVNLEYIEESEGQRRKQVAEGRPRCERDVFKNKRSSIKYIEALKNGSNFIEKKCLNHATHFPLQVSRSGAVCVETCRAPCGYPDCRVLGGRIRNVKDMDTILCANHSLLVVSFIHNTALSIWGCSWGSAIVRLAS